MKLELWQNCALQSVGMEGVTTGVLQSSSKGAALSCLKPFQQMQSKGNDNDSGCDGDDYSGGGGEPFRPMLPVNASASLCSNCWGFSHPSNCFSLGF